MAKEEEAQAKAMIAEAMTKSYRDVLEEVNADGESSNVATASLADANASSTTAVVTTSEPRKKGRVYWLRKVSGSGCPYAASWLAHINLYKKLTWRIDNTKMEAASFVIFDHAHFKFQLEDHTAYFVHHMSMYEHFIHKKHGFKVAENKTTIMSQAAQDGECGNLVVNPDPRFMAFIPFFGGRPPGVQGAADNPNLKVHSIGQGNSLVKAEIKAMQTMVKFIIILTTIFSCFSYPLHVIVVKLTLVCDGVRLFSTDFCHCDYRPRFVAA